MNTKLSKETVSKKAAALENQAAETKGKKPYNKPQLTRLGELKAVAGSGVSW